MPRSSGACVDGPVRAPDEGAAADRVKGMPRVPLAQLGGCEWPEFVWLEEA